MGPAVRAATRTLRAGVTPGRGGQAVKRDSAAAIRAELDECLFGDFFDVLRAARRGYRRGGRWDRRGRCGNRRRWRGWERRRRRRGGLRARARRGRKDGCRGTCARRRRSIRRVGFAGEPCEPSHGEEEKESPAQCRQPKRRLRLFGHLFFVGIGGGRMLVIIGVRNIVVGGGVTHVSAP